jgi:hypothetical protein
MSKNDVIVSTSDFKREMGISSEDLQRVVNHLEIVKEAVSKVLKEGIDSDYAIVPGTQKKALLKPGAEKIMRLFNLGVRFVQVDNELDRYENFALYSYNAEVYNLKTGIVIASCEGTANSQEKKYKERAVYKNKVFAGMEPVPVCDILNTLKKMAQKRAMVGAVILATGASDYFTQDEDEIESQEPVKKPAKKTDVKQFSSEAKDPGEYLVTIGKFAKDGPVKLNTIDKKELADYMEWTAKNNPKIDGKLKEFFDTAREYLSTT